MPVRALVRFRERPINRNFARLFHGQAISVLGTVAFNTTIALWVGAVLARDRSWSPAALGGVMVCAAGAALVVGPLAGVFVDRWDRRRTMMWSDLARALLCLLLAGVAVLPSHLVPLAFRLALIYLFVFGINSIDQFFALARMAVVAQVLESDAQRASGLGMEQATSGVCAIVAPPLSAPLLFAFGAEWALLINAASYLLSYASIRAIELEPQSVLLGQASAKSSYRAQFADGIRLFIRNRTLMSMAGIAVVTQAGIGALSCLELFFLTDNLHRSARLYGLMAMAFGAGGILGALAAGRTVRRLGPRATTWLALLVSGVVIVVYARQTALIPGLVLLAASGVSLAMVSTAVGPLLLRAAPLEYLGRVFAVFNPILQLGWFAAVAVAGWLASTAMLRFHISVSGLTMGRIDTIFSGAGLLIVGAGLGAAVLLPRPGEGQPVANLTPDRAAVARRPARSSGA